MLVCFVPCWVSPLRLHLPKSANKRPVCSQTSFTHNKQQALGKVPKNVNIELRNRSWMLLNHVDCLSLLSVRASLVVVNSGYARRIASVNFNKFFEATRLITFVQGGYTTKMLTLDRGQLTSAPQQWHTRLQAASSVKDPILPKITSKQWTRCSATNTEVQEYIETNPPGVNTKRFSTANLDPW